MNKEQLKLIAKDTLDIINNRSYKIKNKIINISNNLNNTKNNTILYIDDINIDDKEKFNTRCKYEFTEETTMSAAKKMSDTNKTVCVLNFASAKHPGGGFINGSMAQEESIAYISALYDSLTKYTVDFYKYHLEKCNAFYSDRIIYSKDVVVFKDENYNLLETPYFINIITSPAVNAGVIIKNNKAKEIEQINLIMKQRIRKIIKVAIKNENKNIILGAFGCGVFKNKIEDIAKIFKKILIEEGYDKYFDTIVFAIYDKTGEKALNNFRKNFLY